MIPKRNENLWSILTFNLIYPAVLGTLLYTMIDAVAVSEVGRDNVGLRLLASLSILVFYTIDYLFSYLHTTYKVREFVMHTMVIGSLFVSVRMLGIGGTAITAGDHYLFWLAITVAVFAIWDLIHLVYNQLRAAIGMRTVIIEIVMAVVFFACAHVRLQLLPSVIVSWIGCLIMLINFVDWYRKIIKKIYRNASSGHI